MWVVVWYVGCLCYVGCSMICELLCDMWVVVWYVGCCMVCGLLNDMWAVE